MKKRSESSCVPKIIVRIKGGLGNQLFCYAAARRLSLVNNAELVVDDVTGFVRDYEYRRRYMLDHFHIPARKATPTERLEPFERYRRGVMKWWSCQKPFAERRYLEQEGEDFDKRLLALRVKETLYLEGYWQSEDYFKDVESIIRKDLRIIPPTDALNLQMAAEIHCHQAVAVHVRWFDALDSNAINNASVEYYQKAINLIEQKIGSPHYFLFSDNLEATHAKLTLPQDRITCVSHNQANENAYADLWLMSQCQHFIIANSTFSWWGAWLAKPEGKLVIAPKITCRGMTAWGFKGLIPNSWIEL